MRTLASQAEIGVWVQAPRSLLWESGCITPENFEIVYEKYCNLVHFGRKMVHNVVHNAFLNSGNAFPLRSVSFSTMRTAFLRVIPRKDP